MHTHLYMHTHTCSLAISRAAQQKQGGDVVAPWLAQGEVPEAAEIKQAAPAEAEGEKESPWGAEQADKAAVSGEPQPLAQDPLAAAKKPQEFSPLELAASGIVTVLPGDMPQLGPAQSFMISSVFDKGQQQLRQPEGVDAANLAAQLLEEQQEGQVLRESIEPSATGEKLNALVCSTI